MEKYTYGAMSSKYELEADDKLTAYAAMVCHYNQSAHLLVIYSPEECKEDSWTTIDGKISEKLHEIFGGNTDDYKPEENDAFDKYIDEHIDEVKAAYKSIKQLI